MTLEEKVGQLNFLVGDLFNTGPTVRTAESDKFDILIRDGKITGLFNVHGAAYTARLQKIAVEQSRLKIPLLFGADVIHGFKTVMPLSLAEASSWDMEAIELAARIAAEESTAAGINFTFAPMVDISRDARWGRVSEGAGEDPYLASCIAEARVNGFQGKALSEANTLAACIKHFAAYGAPIAGREYNTVDISERTLREIYLPPYKAGIDAGVATVMTAFNELNDIPASGNTYLLKDILRNEWDFNGMVVSDWQSIGEMIEHGYSADSMEAARQALETGVDMDMMSEIYIEQIPELVKTGKLDVALLDNAVRRVLELKYALGLFDNPYIYSDTLREKVTLRSTEHLTAARDIARKSIVLLKNEKQLLPLHSNYKKIAIIGPFGNNKEDMNGSWSFFGEAQHPVSVAEGLRTAMPNTSFIVAEGCNLYNDKTDKLQEAVKAALQSELVLLVVGESAPMHGEGASRADIGLPGIQQRLVEEIYKTGKPIVLLLVNGRPLAIEWVDQHIPAIVETWTLGSEAGNAIADVLTGEFNPSGKLPMSFPRHIGQVPIFYNHKNTGRPYLGDYSEPGAERVYRSRYRDVQNTPLYPFGYGLSYSTFTYTNMVLDKTSMKNNETITVTVTISNTSNRDGDEVVQLYIRDLAGSVTRPIKELKGFKKVHLKAKETSTVTFTIDKEMLSFYRADMSWGSEPGKFHVMAGGSSDTVLKQEITLLP
ncbi:MAG: beta-glucosidase BglX [Cyclobacteriaceae bacterium]|nr:beta-glucosidase BglX [Cyclobacteriaceae bacterium]